MTYNSPDGGGGGDPPYVEEGGYLEHELLG